MQPPPQDNPTASSSSDDAPRPQQPVPLSYETPPTAESQGDDTLRWLGKSVWAMGDQALISGTNFVTMVLAARAMGPTSFGTFSLVYSALLLFNTVQNGLVTQPHNVLASAHKGLDYRRYTTASAIGQIFLAALFFLLALAAAGVAHLMAWPIVGLLLALAAATPAWQLQEFVRRVLYTENRTFDAFLNDIVSYGFQAVALVVIFYRGTITGELTMYVLAITSVLATLLGVWQLRHSVTRSVSLALLRENWNFGKWLVGAEMLGWFCSLHMYQYMAAAIIGPAASGVIKAAQTIFGPMRVFAYFLCTLLPIRFSRALDSGGPARLRSALRGIYVLIAPMLAAYCLVVALFAGVLMQFLYGKAYAADSLVLILYSIAAFIGYNQMILIAAITACRATRRVFFGYVIGGVATCILGWILTHQFGVSGTVMSMIAVNVLVFCFFWNSYSTVRNKLQTTASQESSPPAPLQPMDLEPLPAQPLVSILLCNYNYENFVGETIESVLRQTYPHFELIVVDDGSTDRSCDVIAAYAAKDTRIRFLRKSNGGQASTWNEAYRHASGHIICTLDSDDLFNEDKLQSVVDCFRENPRCGFCMHPLMVIDKIGQHIQVIPFMTRFEQGWIADHVIRRGGRWRFMPASALSFRRQTMDRMLPIPEPIYRRSADAFLFTLAPLLTEVRVIPSVIGRYRTHGANGMSTADFGEKKINRVIDSFQRTLGGVNFRLNEMGLSRFTLDIQRHLSFLEHEFMLKVMATPFAIRLLPKYLQLLRHILADDMYGTAQKLMAIPVYGIVMLLPMSWRSSWIANALGFSPFKERVKKILAIVRKPFPAQRAATSPALQTGRTGA